MEFSIIEMGNCVAKHDRNASFPKAPTQVQQPLPLGQPQLAPQQPLRSGPRAPSTNENIPPFIPAPQTTPVANSNKQLGTAKFIGSRYVGPVGGRVALAEQRDSSLISGRAPGSYINRRVMDIQANFDTNNVLF